MPSLKSLDPPPPENPFPFENFQIASIFSFQCSFDGVTSSKSLPIIQRFFLEQS